ncbi:exo-beta-1,3-glucanase [Phellopilus nigrolimitatus]|nr:exo-beta-1,3-glucanase [Phellopilus nigrolimitatus]
MPRLSASLLLGLVSVLLTTSPCGVRADSPIAPSFPYGSQKVRGVNLGGWLVLEPWITPSLFDATGNDNIVDEWTFGQHQDPSAAEAALKVHWDTFYTEADFAAIAAAGLNHVRLPIGYWAFEVGPGEPYIQGQLPYFKKAIDWAGNHGLKVIADLHGAPGSQNGYDNSGQRLDAPRWPYNGTDIARTKAVLKTIADTFTSNSDVVSIIAPLNEPLGTLGNDVLSPVRDYSMSSYDSIRHPSNSSGQSNSVVLIHDAFTNSSYWSGFMTAPDYQGVAMDTHIYQVFKNNQLVLTEDEHIELACNQSAVLSDYDLGIIVGEWAPAITDCAKYVNGRGIGARYDGTYPNSTAIGSCAGMTGSATSFSDDYKTFLRKFWEAQVSAYETGYGWIQWTWKTEVGTGEEWTYKAGLDNDWIPNDPTEKKHPNICKN